MLYKIKTTSYKKGLSQKKFGQPFSEVLMD